MKCSEESCDGNVDLKKPVFVQTSCLTSERAFSCSKCERLHWKNGQGIINRAGSKMFVDTYGRQYLFKDGKKLVVA